MTMSSKFKETVSYYITVTINQFHIVIRKLLFDDPQWIMPLIDKA